MNIIAIREVTPMTEVSEYEKLQDAFASLLARARSSFELQEELAELREELREVYVTRNEAREDHKRTLVQLETLRTEHINYQDACNTRFMGLDDLVRDRTAFANDQAALAQDLRRENERREAEYIVLRETNERNVTMLHEKVRELEKVTNERDGAIFDYHTADNALADARNACKRLAGEVAELTEAKTVLTENVAYLEGEIEDYKAVYANSQKGLIEVSNANEALTDANNRLHARIEHISQALNLVNTTIRSPL